MAIWGIGYKVTKEAEESLRKAAAKGESLTAQAVVNTLDVLADTSRKLNLAEKIYLNRLLEKQMKEYDAEVIKNYNKPVIEHPMEDYYNSQNTFTPEYMEFAKTMQGGIIKPGESKANDGYVRIESYGNAKDTEKVDISEFNLSDEAVKRAETIMKQQKAFADYCNNGVLTVNIANGQAFKKAAEIVEKGCYDIEDALNVSQILDKFYSRQQDAVKFMNDYADNFVSRQFGENIAVFKRNDVAYPHPLGCAVISHPNGARECIVLESETEMANFTRNLNYELGTKLNVPKDNFLPDYALWGQNMALTPPETVKSWVADLQNSFNSPATVDLLKNLSKAICEGRMHKPFEDRATEKFILRHKDAEMISKSNPDKFNMALNKISEIEQQLNSVGINLADISMRSEMTLLDSKFNLNHGVEKVNGEQLYIYCQTQNGTAFRIAYDEAMNPGSLMFSDSKENGKSLEDIMKAELNRLTPDAERPMVPVLSVRSGLVIDNNQITNTMNEIMKNVNDVKVINIQHEKYNSAKSYQMQKQNDNYERE